ncbi:hypothetical protein ABT061_15645 [Streptosporangium sp. NPDC002544]|uniref:hypothetical protein n=1 Tax=Streptosporangium sp. NPDC002544 TaxID=3154538 RepID=UPI00331C788D
MSTYPYQVGETIDLTLRGARITEVGTNYVDIELADGEEMCIQPHAEGVEIRRLADGAQ